jgi:chemotaxis protein MotB
MINKAVQQNDSLKMQANYEQAAKEVDRLSGVEDRLMVALQKHGLQDDVVTTIDENGLSIHLVSKHVTFEANLATLTPRGQMILDTLAPVLKELPDPIEIEGHTNQVAVKPKYFATDWDLSAARAITVLRRLNEVDGIPSSRLHASAYGHEKPLIDPSEPESQEINKRVDIIIVSSLPPESQALLGQVVKDRERSAEGVTP